MTLELEIEVFWLTPETAGLENAGLSVLFKDTVYRTVTFYHIEAVFPTADDNEEMLYSGIITGGQRYVVPYEYEALKEMIRKARAEWLKQNTDI